MSKIVLVTGTCNGIGKLAAIYFAKLGWNVAAIMGNPSKQNSMIKSAVNYTPLC